MECLSEEARQWCLDDVMGHLPQVQSNEAPDSWRGIAGCGAVVCEAGTYEEANAAIVEHRDAVRAEYGKGS